MLAPSGFLAAFDADGCTGCGKCVKVCPFSAISLQESKAGKGVPVIARKACFGCGICSLHCPSGALRLVREGSRIAPLADILPDKEADLLQARE